MLLLRAHSPLFLSVVTVLVAACDVQLWVYLIAIVIGFPRQMLPVYLGVVLDDKDEGSTCIASRLLI